MKKYWAYQSSPGMNTSNAGTWWSESKTYIFDNKEEAYECAEEDGAFEQCHGKEHWCEVYDKVIFEIQENELKDYEPYIYQSKENTHEGLYDS